MNTTAQTAFCEHCVMLDIEAASKAELIQRLVTTLFDRGVLHASGRALSCEAVVEAVLAREAEAPTGMGNGAAFPHARVQGLDSLAVAFARLRHAVDFGAPDGSPAKYVFLMVLPAARPQVALTLMARAAQLCSRRGERSLLEHEHDPAALARYLTTALLVEETPILARDLMREPIFSVYEDMPLSEVARALAQKDTHATSVITREGCIVGQISCEDLFRVGMPEFFRQLKSIAFIKEFDPFDKYFQFEQGATARDVMTQDYAAVPEDATLLEVVFEIAVKHRPKVYVVRDGKRVGIIDPQVVLDKVINI